MTNSAMLEDAIKARGFTKSEIARKLNITRQGLYKKICGKSEFKQSEIEKLTQLLCLSNRQEKEIFFATIVG